GPGTVARPDNVRWRCARLGSGSLSPPPAWGERGLQRRSWFARSSCWAVDLVAGGGSVVAGHGECPDNTRTAGGLPNGNRRPRGRGGRDDGQQGGSDRQPRARSGTDPHAGRPSAHAAL